MAEQNEKIKRDEIEQDLHDEFKNKDDVPSRIEILLIQILRELIKFNTR